MADAQDRVGELLREIAAAPATGSANPMDRGLDLPSSARRSYRGATVPLMAVRKLSIALDPEVAKLAEASARRQGTSVSSWVNEALAARLRIEEGLAAVAEWEAENGPFTEAERAEADRRLAAVAARARRARAPGARSASRRALKTAS